MLLIAFSGTKQSKPGKLRADADRRPPTRGRHYQSSGPVVRYRSYTPGADAQGDIDALSLWAGHSVGLVRTRADIKLAGSLSLAVSLLTMIVGFTRHRRDRGFAVRGQNRGFVQANGEQVVGCASLP